MYHKTTLPNGLRVISHNIKERDSVALGIWIGVGGRYENDRVKGAAHFLEHMLFKGSKKYGCAEIKKNVEGVGGTLNAFTSEEQTCYYAKIPAQHFAKTFDTLGDMVSSPLLKEQDLEKERTVILEEIKMYHDIPQYFVMEVLDTLIWPNHPLGKSLAGTPESVGKISQDDLRRFHSNNYSPGNIVVASCGRLNHNELVDLVKKKMAKKDSSPQPSFIPSDNSQNKPRAHLFKKEVEQMHVALGMQGLKEDHPDRFALGLLNVIMGANMSSRLFDEVREKRGLAYSISSGAKSMHDTGMFVVKAGVDNHKLVEAVKVILKELEKIKHNGAQKDEFTRAKDYYLGQVLLGLEDTLDHMLWIGESLISLGKTRNLHDVVREVKKVKLSDIARVARDIFRPERYNLAVVGPITGPQEKELHKLLGIA